MSAEKKDLNSLLIEQVVFQIREDIDSNDVESLEELLRFVPVKNLIHYLPEEDWKPFNKLLNDPS